MADRHLTIEDNGKGEAVITGAFSPNAMPYAIISNGVRYVPADALLDALLAERGYEKQRAFRMTPYIGAPTYWCEADWDDTIPDDWERFHSVEVYVPRQQGAGE